MELDNVHPLTGKPWRDNVPRRKTFEAQNPDVVITLGPGWSQWAAKGRLASGAPVDIAAGDLGDLLDELSALQAGT